MRVLILHFLNTENGKYNAIIKNLQAAAENNGNNVTVMDSKDVNNLHFPMYEYIVIVTNSAKLFGAKLPLQLKDVLANHDTLSGIKGCSLVVKGGFSSEKMNFIVMHAMEAEGMQLDYFHIIDNPEQAKSIGKKIG